MYLGLSVLFRLLKFLGCFFKLSFYISIYANSITGSAIVYGSTCVLLMIGVQVQKHSLMIPYLIVQILMIVMTAIVGIPIAIGLFYVKHPLYGLSVTTAVLFTSILPIYFWFTVKRAYTDMAKMGKLSKDRNQNNLECGYVKK